MDFFGSYFFNNFKKPSPSFQRADPPNFVSKSSTPSPPQFQNFKSNCSTYFAFVSVYFKEVKVMDWTPPPPLADVQNQIIMEEKVAVLWTPPPSLWIVKSHGKTSTELGRSHCSIYPPPPLCGLSKAMESGKSDRLHRNGKSRQNPAAAVSCREI